jgi:RNA polymerase sigma factor (sigma-70 family)
MSESAPAAARPAPARPPDFAARTDADLFEVMARADSRAEGRADAHAAFAEFHRRHTAYLFAVCARRYRGEAEEIVAEALRRVYASAAQFDAAALRTLPGSDAARRFVRAWLGRIVRWVAADHFAARLRDPPTVARAVVEAVSEPDRRAEPDGVLVARVREVIESLSEREREIAWTVAHGWSPQHGRVRWSEDDLDAVAARFGLTRENIRQVRARLIRKLRARLEPLLDARGGETGV